MEGLRLLACLLEFHKIGSFEGLNFKQSTINESTVDYRVVAVFLLPYCWTPTDVDILENRFFSLKFCNVQLASYYNTSLAWCLPRPQDRCD